MVTKSISGVAWRAGKGRGGEKGLQMGIMKFGSEDIFITLIIRMVSQVGVLICQRCQVISLNMQFSISKLHLKRIIFFKSDRKVSRITKDWKQMHLWPWFPWQTPGLPWITPSQHHLGPWFLWFCCKSHKCSSISAHSALNLTFKGFLRNCDWTAC